MKSTESELSAKIDELARQLEINDKEFEKHKSLQQDYRKLLNDILMAEKTEDKKRNSAISQSSEGSYRSASAVMTTTSKADFVSDYGDHETLDKELAEAEQEEIEPTVSEIRALLKEDSRLSIVDTTEHSRVVKDLRLELEAVRSSYEEDTSELQKTLSNVKSQLLTYTRQRSISQSSGSESTASEKSESTLAKVRNLQLQIEEQREEHKGLVKLLETAQTLATDREQKVNELLEQLETLRNDYEEQSIKVDQLSLDTTQLKIQNAESLQKVLIAQKTAREFEQKAEDTARLLQSIKSERDTSIAEITDLKKKLERLTAKHANIISLMVADNREEVTNLQKDNSEYLAIIQHLKDQVSECEATISTHLLQITSLQQKLEALAKDSEKSKRAKTAAERDLKDLRNEFAILTRQKHETRDKLSEVTALLDQLQRDYESLQARKGVERDSLAQEQSELIAALESRLQDFESRPTSADKRLRSGSLSGRWSNDTPTPPPAMPLPPLPPPPASPTSATAPGRASTPRGLSRTNSQDRFIRSNSRDQLKSPDPDGALIRQMEREIEDKTLKIQNLEKQFQSERQLVQTLEEALSDTEKSMKQLKKQTNSLAAEKEVLHTKMLDVSHQLEIAKKEAVKSRDSIQQLDEARAQRAKVFLLATELMVVGSSATSIRRSNGRDRVTKTIKILMLLEISYHLSIIQNGFIRGGRTRLVDDIGILEWIL
jgi:DNA repair exonuclease SbcCD ATPase subunit